MHPSKNNQLADRLEARAKARQATLVRFRARPTADDPAVVARQVARLAVAQARDVRVTVREAARRIATAERKAEALAAETHAADERVRRATEKAEQLAALAEKQKATRDARFAARKARSRR